MVPHLGGGGGGGVIENNNLCVCVCVCVCVFLNKLRVKCHTCVVVDKTRTTYGHGLVDLRTYWQYTDCITKYGSIINGSLDKPQTYNSRPDKARTYYSRTWQSTERYLNYGCHLWYMKKKKKNTKKKQE